MSSDLGRGEQSFTGDRSTPPPARIPQLSSGLLNIDPPRAERSSIPITPTVDLQHIQRWRQACRATHGACCNDDYSNALAKSIDQLMLVDVISGSLTILPTSSPIKYVALSYVWGNAPMFKTTTNNIETLLQRGALYEPSNNAVLPDTIRDAIHLVKALGEKYLWVDCLSVVQDAGSEKMDITLRAMARIYASAEFTIVAAGGEDAGHGLRGIGGPSTNRTPNPSSFSRRWDAYPRGSKWATRGWTFQESLFSRRLLVFRNTVSWVCGRCEWREGVDKITSTQDSHDRESITSLRMEDTKWPAERPHLGVPMGMMSLIPKIPTLGRWGMLVENFSSRDLKYEKDAQAAFAGATDIMDATFPDGLLHGIPKFFFDIALLWRPQNSARRREGEPSWSWTGWKNGTIDCLSAWYPFYPRIFRDTGLELDWVAIATLKPVAEYRLANAVDGSSSQFNGFYRYQALRKDPDETLPTGWSRNYDPEGDYFTNTAYSQSTRYPFPLPIVDPTERRPHVPISTVLRCRAPCIHLTFGRVKAGDNRHRMLRNDKQIIGNITITCETLDHEPEDGSDCELVAISEAETSQQVGVEEYGWPDFSFEEYQKFFSGVSLRSNSRKASFYNVMYIEWVGNVAERRGLGVVLKESWDALQPEVKEFNLG